MLPPPETADPDDSVIAALQAVTDADRELVEPPVDLWSRIEGQALDTRSEVIDLASRRAGRRRAIAIIGAVAAATVLIAGVAGMLRTDRGSTEVVASANLSLLAGGGSGTAELEQRDDGLFLVIDVDGLAPAEQADFYELWLLAPDVSDMASLARFEKGSGEVEVRVPDGVDPSALPVVDISEEIDDGDDTHSGLSILRGELT